MTGPRYLLSLSYSVVGHSLSGLAVYIVARSLAVDLPLLLTIALTCVVLLISMVPISFAGWGLRGVSFLTSLAPLHVNGEDAIPIGVLFGLIGLIAALPSGLSLMFGWGKEGTTWLRVELHDASGTPGEEAEGPMPAGMSKR